MGEGSEVLTLLEPPEQQAWRDYERLRSQGLRREALHTLDHLLDRLTTYPDAQRQAWAMALCRAHLDPQVGERLARPLLPHPLVVRLILPELRICYDAGSGACARWLALLAPEVHHAWKPCLRVLGWSDYQAELLLREAVRRDPGDTLSRQALLDKLASALDFYLHHLPETVLTDPATFSALLSEFVLLAEEHDTLERYASRLARWQFHAQAWEDYWARRHEYAGYRQYLARRAEETERTK